jgi:hypothetical protein
MKLTKAQASLAIKALMPKIQALSDMLHLQIKNLPPDCDDWMHTQKLLRHYQDTADALAEVGR